MKASKVLFNISAVVCFLCGALYIFSLVFIPVGVYCFIASKRFAFKAEHLYEDFAVSNQTLKNWVIFASIACFPLGLISIIPYWFITSNNVKVESFNIKISEDDSNADFKTEVAEAEQTESLKEEVVQEETEEEKLEKFKKLENFREKGIITEEELEMAREQLFGKQDKNA